MRRREPPSLPINTRFTVGLEESLPPFHPFHCWARREPPSLPKNHPFHCWARREPPSPYFPFHCWARGGTSRLYASLLPWGIHHPIYASLPPYVGCTCLPVYMPPRCTLPTRSLSSSVMSVIPGLLKRRGSLRPKGSLFTLRINPSQPEKGPERTKKPATESTVAQGM